MKRLALVVVIAGCTDPVVSQRGLVPRGRLPSFDGQAMDRPMRFEGYGETTAISPGTGDTTSGALVARHQFGGALRMRTGDHTDLGLTFDSAVADGAVPRGSAADSTFRATPYGVGVSFRFSNEVSPGLRMGLSLDASLWSIPIDPDNDITGAASATVVTSYRASDNVVVFGNLGAVAQPDIPAERLSSGAATTTVGSLLVAGGVRFDASEQVHLIARAQMPIASPDPLAPIVGAWVSIDVGDKVRPPQPYPATYYPPPPPAYYPPPPPPGPPPPPPAPAPPPPPPAP